MVVSSKGLQSDEEATSIEKGKEMELSSGSLNHSNRHLKRSPTMESNYWLSEIDNQTITESAKLSKIQYSNICNDVQTCLDSLLSEDKTSVFATVSRLFRSFRGLFLSSQKLKNKIFELESLRRLENKTNEDVSDQDEIRNEKIRYLESRLEASEIKSSEAEKAMQELKLQVDESKKSDQSGVKFVPRDRKLFSEETLNNKALHSKATNTIISQQKSSKAHAENSEEKMQQEEKANFELQHRIHALQEELKSEIQLKIQAQVLISKRDKELQKQQNVVDSLKENIQSLKFDLGTANSQCRSLMSDLNQCRKKLDDANSNINSLKTTLSSQKFHVMTLKTKKGTLEKQICQMEETAHSLQLELDKKLKLQSDLETKVYGQEQKIAELKVFYEQKLEEVSLQNLELQELLKQDVEKDEVIQKTKKEIQKLVDELKHSNQELKDRTDDLNVEKEAHIKTRQTIESLTRSVTELETKLKSQEAKKEDQDAQIIHLTSTITELRNQINSLVNKDIRERSELSRLKKELKKEKDLLGNLRDSERAARRQLEGTSTKLKETKELHQAFADGTKKQIERIKALEDQVGCLQQKIASLTGDNNNLSYSLGQLKNRKHELLMEVQSKDKECVRAMELVRERDHELETVRHMLQRMMERKIVVECKVAEKDREIAMMEEKNLFLEKEGSGCRKTLRMKEEEIRILETEFRMLAHSKSVMKKRVCEAENLKRDINCVRGLFEKERLKTKAMEHALQKPVNIHRWRFLEGVIPAASHLIRKNIFFQRELMKKTDALSQRETELKYKDEVIEGLREDLRRRRRRTEDEMMLRRGMEENKERMRMLLAEREVGDGMLSKYRDEIARLKREVREMKVMRMRRDLSM